MRKLLRARLHLLPPFRRRLRARGRAGDGDFPFGPLQPEVALNLTVVSYDGRLEIGLICCPDVVADVGQIASGFVSAIETFLAASG